MVLFSLLKRPESFHLQQDTDLPVNRGGRFCFHFSGIKGDILFYFCLPVRKTEKKEQNELPSCHCSVQFKSTVFQQPVFLYLLLLYSNSRLQLLALSQMPSSLVLLSFIIYIPS